MANGELSSQSGLHPSPHPCMHGSTHVPTLTLIAGVSLVPRWANTVASARVAMGIPITPTVVLAVGTIAIAGTSWGKAEVYLTHCVLDSWNTHIHGYRGTCMCLHMYKQLTSGSTAERHVHPLSNLYRTTMYTTHVHMYSGNNSACTCTTWTGDIYTAGSPEWRDLLPLLPPNWRSFPQKTSRKNAYTLPTSTVAHYLMNCNLTFTAQVSTPSILTTALACNINIIAVYDNNDLLYQMWAYNKQCIGLFLWIWDYPLLLSEYTHTYSQTQKHTCTCTCTCITTPEVRHGPLSTFSHTGSEW